MLTPALFSSLNPQNCCRDGFARESHLSGRRGSPGVSNQTTAQVRETPNHRHISPHASIDFDKHNTCHMATNARFLFKWHFYYVGMWACTCLGICVEVRDNLLEFLLLYCVGSVTEPHRVTLPPGRNAKLLIAGPEQPARKWRSESCSQSSVTGHAFFSMSSSKCPAGSLVLVL